MVYEDIAANKRNTFFLILLIIAIISGLGYLIGEFYGEPYTFTIFAFIISLFMSFFSYYFSDSVVIAITGAKPADRKIHTQYFLSAEGLSIAAGIPMPKLYVLEDDNINAFATGRDPKHSAIAVTYGALKKLNKFELEGVIAHEISHIKNYDVLIGTVAAVLVGMIIIITDAMKRNIFRSRRRVGGGRGNIVFFIIFLIAAIIAPIAGILLQYAISRQREYLADAQAVLLTRYPKGLIGALTKIKNEYMPPEEVNRGISHLYFAFPLSIENSNLFSTHPKIDSRIARLQTMEYK
ncbi:MAG: M48 family metallopeptidase [Candidatus Goldbacteria bacterium]|nr:M48 family metallopeptidase [Candidatus Goldiibacteriota bacterium]